MCLLIHASVAERSGPPRGQTASQSSDRGETERRGGGRRYLFLFGACVLKRNFIFQGSASVSLPLRHWCPAFSLQAAEAHGRAALSHAVKSVLLFVPPMTCSLHVCASIPSTARVS